MMPPNGQDFKKRCWTLRDDVILQLVVADCIYDTSENL